MTAFEVTATDGAARAGVLRTAHGDVPTPAFMPVGTKATVKSLHPDEVRAAGAAILLGNTYHLHFRPGEDLIAELGGLHAFMGWDGPILTDSGGFQVFSLRDTIAGGRRRGRHLPLGLRRRPGALHAGAGRGDPGEARLRRRDVPRRLPARRAFRARSSSEAVRRTTTWAARQRDAPRAPGQLVFGIAQGGVRPRAPRPLDRRRSRRSASTATRSAGSRSARTAAEMLETSSWSAPLLPADQPRYFMGIGDPEGILEVIARGIDMFDCVLPTRLGRTGTALTSHGRLNLRNARFARDPRPLDERCACPACARFSRAYLRHLVNQNELLGAAAAQPPQSSLPARPHRRRAVRDRGRAAGRLHAGDAATDGERSMSSGGIFILVLLVLFLVWLMLVRPQRRRQRNQQAMIDDLRVGRRDRDRRRALRDGRCGSTRTR